MRRNSVDTYDILISDIGTIVKTNSRTSKLQSNYTKL